MKTWSIMQLLTFSVFLSGLFTTTFSFCPQYCSCNDTSLSVTCHSSSSLRVVPIVLNPLLKSLTLSHNQIKDITLSLQFYPELGYLDISGNHLHSLGKGNFESLRALEFLNVSYNQVKALESGVFQGLGTLNVLDLTGNQVERVESVVFWGLRNVQEIILDRNRLEFIDWDLFRGLDNLVKISVQYNFIQIMEPSSTLSTTSAPWSLKNVEFLDISFNQLTRVKDNSLHVFSNLKELNLCCNYIHTLEEKAFNRLNTLHRMNLSQNQLGKVPTTSLVPLASSLRQVDLSSNRLSNILPSDSFHSLIQLEDIRLNDNPNVLSIHADALSEQLNLLNFEADYLPNLTDFSASLLRNKPNLKRFSLKYAQISLIPLQLVEDLGDSTAMSLDLTGNPVECNCSAYPLFQYLQHYAQTQNEEDFLPEPLTNMSHAHQPYIGHFPTARPKNTEMKKQVYLLSVKCHGPSSVAGILVKDLKPSDFVECFTSTDEFQMMVIIIAAVIVSIIFLAVVVKLCCLGGEKKCKWIRSGNERKRNFCGKKCPCFSRGDKHLDLDKCDRLFEGFRRDLPSAQNQMQIQQNPFEVQQNQNGKLFFSADNSTPSHQPYPQGCNNHNGMERGHRLEEEERYHQFQPLRGDSHTIRLQPYLPHPQTHHTHTLNRLQHQPLPLPPQSYNYSFNTKPSPSYHSNYVDSEEDNEYTNPQEMNLNGEKSRKHNNYVHFQRTLYC